MKWSNHGLIYQQQLVGYSSHVQCPVVEDKGNIWRIYFSSRDNHNRSLPFYLDIEAGNPHKIIQHSTSPIFMPNAEEGFDQHGIMPTEVIQHNNQTLLYYIGWNLNDKKPYRNLIGQATFNEKQWIKQPQAVITGHSSSLYTGTFGVHEVNGKYLGYYLSCCDWIDNSDGCNPKYNIAIAESQDLKHWQCDKHIAIDFKNPKEAGICSARVVEYGNCLHMFYCYRNAEGFRDNAEHAYKIGYAQSLDGYHWQRHDEKMAGFDQQQGDIANIMQCYPYLIKHQDQLFMFYNGNDFGQSGLACATISLDDLPAYIE